MLEEYRYYEAIKRKRQDDLNLMKIIEEHKANTEILKLIIEKLNSTTNTKLANGETTETLEIQKIVNEDFDLFTKITEVIRAIKTK